jgi:hypothetical protein
MPSRFSWTSSKISLTKLLCLKRRGIEGGDFVGPFEMFSSNYFPKDHQVHSPNSQHVFAIPQEFVQSIVHDSIVLCLRLHSCEPDKSLVVSPDWER